MNQTQQTCSKCSTDLDRPHRENANYVLSDDFVEPKPTEVYYAMVLTDEARDHLDYLCEKIPTKSRRAIAAEMADPDAPDTVKVVGDTNERVVTEDGDVIDKYVEEELEFSYPVENFEHHEIADIDSARSDPDVAYIYTQVEERDVQKTGLICRDCLDADDVIIWGADK